MLSICIIAKNEEKNITRCLNSLQFYNFEIIVVDTGSTDATREIALQYTSKVYDFVWRDDFAAAKNYAISKATYPCVMILDSDEYVESMDIERLKTLMQQNPSKVGRIQRRNIFTRKGEKQQNREWINRLFAREEFHYEGRIHEQVQRICGGEYGTYEAPVVILHTGYDLSEAERRQKAKRNIDLLEQELSRLSQEEQTDTVLEQVPYILYQLGKGYYMAGQHEMACDYFSKGLSYDLNPKREYVIDMVETYGYALINSNQADQALFFENIYEEFGHSADFQFLMGLIYMNNARFEAAIQEFLKATQHTECRGDGVNSYRAYYNVGVIYECLGAKETALEYYQRCGDYEEAKKRCEKISCTCTS